MKDVSNNPPGERRPEKANPEQQPPGAREEPRTEQRQGDPSGQPSPGLKDKEARTSDSYGNTRDSGEGR